MRTELKVLLSEREVIEALSIGRSLLRRMMAEGRITGSHIGRRLVFHVDDRRFADEIQQEARAGE